MPAEETTKQGLGHLSDETLAGIVEGSEDLDNDDIAKAAFRELAKRTPGQ